MAGQTSPRESELTQAASKGVDKPDLQDVVTDAWFRAKPATKDNAFLDESVSRSEFNFMHERHKELTPADVANLKHEINQKGKVADEALVEALRNNRVLAVGDVHLKASPHNQLLID